MTTQSDLQPPHLSASRPALSWIIALFILMGWLVLGALAAYVASNQAAGYTDFEVYFDAAVSLYSGQNPYVQKAGPYLYPPLLAQLLMPFVANFSYEVTAALWFTLNFAALALTVFMLHPHIPPQNRRGLWLMPVLFIPLLKAMYVGQVTIIMLALLAGVWVAVQRERRVLAGMLLALACWLKVYPALLVLYFIWKRDGGVFRGVLIGGLALLLLQVLISGPALLLESFTVIFELAGAGLSYGAFKNSSITGFASRLFLDYPSYDVLLLNPTLYQISRAVLMLLVAGVTIFFVSRPSKTIHNEGGVSAADYDSFDLEYCLVIVAMLLLSSVLWVSGMPPLLLIYSLLFFRPTISNPNSAARLMLKISFILTSVYHLILLGYNPQNPLILSIGFFGIFLLWVTTVTLLWTNQNKRWTTPGGAPNEPQNNPRHI